MVDRPFLRQRGESVRRRAGATIVERRHLAPERDVDGQRDLLDRREAVELVGADVARQVEELVVGRTVWTSDGEASGDRGIVIPYDRQQRRVGPRHVVFRENTRQLLNERGVDGPIAWACLGEILVE